MIIGIEGGLGDGKTIFMVRCLFKDFKKGRHIFTNLHLNNIEYNILDIQQFLDDKDNNKLLHNATIGIDEITVFMDCRRSSKKENIYLSYLILQSRKRNLDIYYTSQDIQRLCDIRLIDYTSIFIIANRIYYRDEKTNEVKELHNYREYTIIDTRNRQADNVTRMRLNISQYFSYFNTDQIIEPLMKK